MQGIFLNNVRPKSKKEISDFLDAHYEQPEGNMIRRLTIERTAVMGDEYGGPLDDAPISSQINFVGPDPYTDRKFYGNIVWNGERWVVH